MNAKDEVVIKIKEAYLRLDDIKDKFNKEKKKLEWINAFWKIYF